MTETIITRSAAETEAAGERLAARLTGGTVLCLSGDLGGGKTTFMKGLARACGVATPITSPTFLVEAIYKGKRQKSSARPSYRGLSPRGSAEPAKGKNVYHFDVYRVKDSAEILALGWEEVLADPGGLVVVEWAERIKDILPPRCLWVRFKFIDADTREIEIGR